MDYDDFYPLLDGHESLTVKKILQQDDKLYRLLFNNAVVFSPELDSFLYLLISTGYHENFINTLKRGFSVGIVYDDLRACFSIPSKKPLIARMSIVNIGEDLVPEKVHAGWCEKSKTEKKRLIIQLINRFYSTNYSTRHFLRPVIVDRKPSKGVRRKKYTKINLSKNTILISPYSA